MQEHGPCYAAASISVASRGSKFACLLLTLGYDRQP